MDSVRFRPGLITLVITLLAAIVLSECFMARRNILAYKKDWKIAQDGFINPGLGVVPDLIYRQVLAGYRLHSDHLMGIQRIFSRDEIHPEKLEAWFRLGNEGYVDLITGATDKSYFGVRLSSSSIYPSMLYEADYAGKYLLRSPLKAELPPGFAHVVIENGEVKSGKNSWKLPENFFRPGKSGVQISFKDTELFGFAAKGGKKKHDLHFFPEGNRVSLYLQTFLLLLFCIFVSGFFPSLKRKQVSLFLLGLGVVLFIFPMVYNPGDEQIDTTLGELKILDAYWKPSGEEKITDIINDLHRDRFFPGIHFCSSQGCHIVTESEIPSKKHKRLLFFGGSQIQPSLVTRLEDSLFYRFQSQIRKTYPELEILNVHSLGLFRERLEKFQDLLPKLEFDEIIIETLAFDHETEGIISFMREWKSKGKKVIFLRRAINPLLLSEDRAPYFMEEIRKGFQSQHGNEGWHIPEVIRVMPQYREAQKEIGYIFLDPNAYLMKPEIFHSGEIFWDGFHFTAWGQQLVADWLAREYLNPSQSSK